MNALGPPEWIAIITLIVPSALFVLSATGRFLRFLSQGIKYLGAIDNTLSQLSKWMVVFGEEHVELKKRVQDIEKWLERAEPHVFPPPDSRSTPQRSKPEPRSAADDRGRPRHHDS